MSVTCPNGHQSSAEDYCDTCGVPIPSGAAAAGAGAAASGETGLSTTAPPGAATEAGSGAPTGEGATDEGATGPSTGPTAGAGLGPAEPETPEAAAPAPTDGHICPNCSTENVEGALFCEACGYDFTTGAMPRGVGTGTGAVEIGEPGAAAGPAAGAGAPAKPAFEWVAEIWVDPDWYRTQESEDPCPSPGLPTIVPLHHRSVLLGRVSVSKNTHPEIELSSDPGVSRRHAQLTTDGTRWFVEDLGSSNGTFVGPASGPLPEQAIAVGPKTELGDDDRLYVGAWTRVVVRAATPDEVEAYA